MKEALLAEFENEMRITRRLLERLPGASMKWAPHERSMRLGRLASHLPEILEWGEAVLTEDELNFAPGVYMPWDYEQAGDVLELFDDKTQSISRLLEEIPDERLLDNWSMTAGEHVLMSMPRFGAIRTLVLNHLIHHRGQLTVYLRLLEVPLPPVYGPTADAED